MRPTCHPSDACRSGRGWSHTTPKFRTAPRRSPRSRTASPRRGDSLGCSSGRARVVAARLPPRQVALGRGDHVRWAGLNRVPRSGGGLTVCPAAAIGSPSEHDGRRTGDGVRPGRNHPGHRELTTKPATLARLGPAVSDRGGVSMTTTSLLRRGVDRVPKTGRAAARGDARRGFARGRADEQAPPRRCVGEPGGVVHLEQDVRSHRLAPRRPSLRKISSSQRELAPAARLASAVALINVRAAGNSPRNRSSPCRRVTSFDSSPSIGRL